MSRRRAGLAIAGASLLLVALAGHHSARAEPPRRLELRARPPFRPTLAMRRPAAPAAGPVSPVRPERGAERSEARSRRAGASLDPSTPAPVDRAPAVRAQLVTGFALDGATPSAMATTLAGRPITEGPRDLGGFARARAYGFGSMYLGARNLPLPGLHGHLAAEARFLPTVPLHAPVPTAWDQAEPLHVRSGWAEADGVLTTPLLRPLTLRAGRQYVYGPFIAHLDGAHLRWRRGPVAIAAYAGSRVPDWSARPDAPRGLEPQRGFVAGAEVAVDLRRTVVPVLVRVRALSYQNRGHADLTVDGRLRRTLDVTALARTYDGAIAHENLTVRYRLSERTRLVVDAGYRHARDPLWDLAYRDPADDVGAARRYLDLGPRLPRANLRVRAGTVLLDNVDLLLSGGAAIDASDPTRDASLHAAGWLEGGGALEVRVRRTFALGLSGLVRGYNRSDPEEADIVIDVEDQPGPLVLPREHVGELSMIEGGMSARFSGGARSFSVAAEIYARRTRFGEHYRDDGAPGADDLEAVEDAGPIGRDNLRGGSRITLHAWVTDRIRLRGEYDISTALEAAPEVRDLKSLRIVVEGTL